MDLKQTGGNAVPYHSEAELAEARAGGEEPTAEEAAAAEATKNDAAMLEAKTEEQPTVTDISDEDVEQITAKLDISEPKYAKRLAETLHAHFAEKKARAFAPYTQGG